MNQKPTLAVIGGMGWHQFEEMKDTSSIEIDTPFGKPSAPITTGILQGRPIAFLARHGLGHQIPGAQVNYRANIYALKSLGIKQVVGVTACYSLRMDFEPGHIVIPDQLIDFTFHRTPTFFTEGIAAQINSAEPFCSHLSTEVYQAAIQTDTSVHLGGTLITIEGPRSSTIAESNLFRSWSASIVNTTTCPEAFLAREAGLCYAVLAHVVRYDAWQLDQAPHVKILDSTLGTNIQIQKQAVQFLAENLPEETGCQHQNALEDGIRTDRAYISPEAAQKLEVIIGKNLSE